MPASHDEKSRRSSEPYLPPPPSSKEDSPDLVEVPRIQPPPKSLRAMLQRRDSGDATSPWALFGILVLLAAAVLAYVLR